MIREPEQEREKPSAVITLPPKPEVEGREVNMDTEAPEPIRSWRYIREESEAPAGRENTSSCLPASFRTISRNFYTSVLSLHGTFGNSTGRVRRNGKELRKQQKNGENWDLEWEHHEHEEGQGLGLHGPGICHAGLGRKKCGSQRRQGEHTAPEDLVCMEGQGERIGDAVGTK